jgi:hypothetical protein
MAIIHSYTTMGAIIFTIVSIALLAADRYAENHHLKESEAQ